MIAYYVRTSGSDAADGKRPETAKATIGSGLALLARGDTLYVGGGTYPEAVARNRPLAGAAGVASLIGDVDGRHTGDPGEVLLTAFADPSQPPAAQVTLQFYNASHWYLSGLTVVGGALADANCLYLYGSTSDVTVEDCTFWGATDTDGPALMMWAGPGAVPLATFNRCRFIGAQAALYLQQSGTATDWRTTFRNCTITAGFSFFAAGGGVLLDSCRIVGAINTGKGWSTTAPLRIRHCVSPMGLPWVNEDGTSVLYATTLGQIDEDHNVWARAAGLNYYHNVTPGPHSVTSATCDVRPDSLL